MSKIKKFLTWKVYLVAVLILVAVALTMIIFTNKEVDPRCERLVKFGGFCQQWCDGVQYNDVLDKCTKIGNACCTIDTPFEDVESCKQACVE